MIRYSITKQRINWNEAVVVFERAPLGKRKRDPEKPGRLKEIENAMNSWASQGLKGDV